jgi:hypothetical protein
MAHLITAHFTNHAQGQVAADRLRRLRFPRGAIRFVTQSTPYLSEPGGARSVEEALLLALTREDGLSRDAATAHAVSVRNGAAFVSVRAKFGQANRVVAFLRDSGADDVQTYVARDPSEYDPADPPGILGLPAISKTTAPLSGFFKLPLLSDRPTPVSRFLRLPLLINRARKRRAA